MVASFISGPVDFRAGPILLMQTCLTQIRI